MSDWSEMVNVQLVDMDVRLRVLESRIEMLGQTNDASDANELASLRQWLHRNRLHPGYEYATTQGPRKGFYLNAPSEGWEPNIDVGRLGWERFDEHEEAYWRRRRGSHAEPGAGGV